MVSIGADPAVAIPVTEGARMPLFNFHLVVSGDLASAQTTMRAVLEDAGFTIEDKGGHWKASHGSLAKTVFLGLLASAASTHEVFDVKFEDQGGTVKVDLHRPMVQISGSGDDGLEAMRLYQAYDDLIAQFRADLQKRGVLVG
jgi:hypothetical protein